MTACYLTFHKQAISGGFLPVRVAASNGDFAGSTEANIYPDEFKFFAEQLKTYPRMPGDKVFFSSGGDDEIYQSYLYLLVYATEADGQSGLQVRLRRNEPKLQAGGAAFTLTLANTTINALGQALAGWLMTNEEILDFQI